MRSCSECGLTYRSSASVCGLDGAPIVEMDHDPLVGRTIGPYRILERLDEGGYAILYRVHDGEDRALKLLLGEMASLPQYAERFRREALAMRRIDHPNVAAVYDFGETEKGLTYLVMELLEGRLLASELEGGPLDPTQVIRIGLDLARGLAAAHAVGCIHRDVTPRNVMLVESGHAKLFDFGLVSLKDPEDPRSQVKLTDLGTIVGTAEYVAPEVGFGHPATPKADLYSLGVLLHEMRFGRPPFTGSARDIFAAHITEELATLDITDPLQQLIMDLLDRKPDRRPGTAELVAERLESLG